MQWTGTRQSEEQIYLNLN
ncbi:Protein of unknown function [Lactobacillus helveticus CIRM-BIA 101]|nr:Protein of unknown function [Lactobacillus helveticus CIRM-BIA 101]